MITRINKCLAKSPHFGAKSIGFRINMREIFKRIHDVLLKISVFVHSLFISCLFKYMRSVRSYIIYIFCFVIQKECIPSTIRHYIHCTDDAVI